MVEFIAGLDIGTTKICAVAAESGPGGSLHITGLGASPSRGVKKGMIVDLDNAAGAVREAVDEAEKQSGKEIRRVAAGISGAHVRSINASGVSLVTDGKVKSSDIDDAIENAVKTSVPMGVEILHAIPSGYRIDEQREIKDPIGMHARHLEVAVHFLTAESNPYENFRSCVRSAGLELEYLAFQPLGAVYPVLNEEEKEMGAVLLDMGGGTTDIVVVEDGAALFGKVIPLGGETITSDIAACLRVSQKAAEKIKIEYGRAVSDDCPDKRVRLRSVDKSVPLKFISEIIEARIEEIFDFAAREISGLRGLSYSACGMVVTGGGSLLEGFLNKAESFLNMPVRNGEPVQNTSGIEKYGSSPAYSAAVGLAGLYFLEKQMAAGQFFPGSGTFGAFNRKVKTWFRDLL